MAGSEKNLAKEMHYFIITAGMRGTHPISIRNIIQPLKYLLRYRPTVKQFSNRMNAKEHEDQACVFFNK